MAVRLERRTGASAARSGAVLRHREGVMEIGTGHVRAEVGHGFIDPIHHDVMRMKRCVYFNLCGQLE